MFDCVIDVLKTLSKKVKLVCLSASLKETLVKQLKFYKIHDFFDYIVGLDDTHANSKEQVAKDFIIKNNIDTTSSLLVGDSIHDYEVASSINVDCVLVSTGHTSKERLLKTNCKVIDNLSDLIL